MTITLSHITLDAKGLMTSTQQVSRYVFRVAVEIHSLNDKETEEFLTRLHRNIIRSGYPYIALSKTINTRITPFTAPLFRRHLT